MTGETSVVYAWLYGYLYSCAIAVVTGTATIAGLADVIARLELFLKMHMFLEAGDYDQIISRLSEIEVVFPGVPEDRAGLLEWLNELP